MKRMLVSILALVLMLTVGALGMAEENVTVGVIQYASHPSLDNCTEGFLLGLADGGYIQGENLTVDFQNAMADMATSDMQAKLMVSQGEDMLVGVATPAAMSAYSATVDSQTPVLFVAVSDPVAAGIVETIEAPGSNCTGVSDVLNLEEQVKMIRAFLPEGDTIGVLYTVSEPNSISHLERLNEIAPRYGFTVAAVGVTNASEVGTAAVSLCQQGVDAINNFTDNLVVENLPAVLLAAEEACIPVFGSEVEQVVNGCLAAQGIDYVELGRAAGLMAARVLNGEVKPEALAVEMVKEVTPTYNGEVLSTLGLTLPQEFADAADVAAK